MEGGGLSCPMLTDALNFEKDKWSSIFIPRKWCRNSSAGSGSNVWRFKRLNSMRSGQNKLFWLIRLQILLERPLFVDWFGCNWLCRDSRLIRENLFQLRHFSGASQALGRWNRLSKCGRRQALSIRSLDVAVLPPEFRIEIPDHFY